MGQYGQLSTNEAFDIQVGVLLPESAAEVNEVDEILDDTGHVPASGNRGRHVAASGKRVAELGREILAAAATAVGREVALVVSGVVAGIEHPDPLVHDRPPLQTGSFVIDNLELTFGVKVTMGAGKAVEAFFTAGGETTVEVKLTLRQPDPSRIK